MNRRFQLFPDGNEQQRLRVSMPLVDVRLEEGFAAIAEYYGVEVSEAQNKSLLGSGQELVVRPPIPKDKIASFGQALVAFVESIQDPCQNEVLFLDHTEEMEQYRAVIARKLNPQGKIR